MPHKQHERFGRVGAFASASAIPSKRVVPEPSSSAPLQIVSFHRRTATADVIVVRAERNVFAFKTGSLPSQTATTFCVGNRLVVLATLIVTFLCAFNRNGFGSVDP
jgi:hypothetical protein